MRLPGPGSMTFWQAFFRTLRWRPMQAFAGLYWHLTRRRVRARNRLRLGAEQAPYAYDYWIQSAEDHGSLASQAEEIVNAWKRQPSFSIVMTARPDTTAEHIEATIGSLAKQLYSNLELIVTSERSAAIGRQIIGSRLIEAPVSDDEGTALGCAIFAASGDYVVPIVAGDQLSRAALFRFAEVLQDQPSASIVYGDQDEIGPRGRRLRPWFKPQWDDEMFLAQDYLSEACAVEAQLARGSLHFVPSADEAATFSLLLAATSSAPGPIVHTPYIVSHVRTAAKVSNQAARVAAVGRHLEPVGGKSAAGPFDSVKAIWPLPPQLPGVSIVIPTRDKADLLRACVDSVLRSTDYPQYEVLVVDNGSNEPDALAYLDRIRTHPQVSILNYDHPYNYSAINNFAAPRAAHPYLCLLNNDTEVIAPEWLTEMMRYAVRPDVGAVGAKLLYDDGSIQHAGVIIGICEAAGHAHRFERPGSPGYFARPHLAHTVSAVTAACLVVEKSKFDTVGGLDADRLAIAYNDVDLCLKLEKVGWRNIYVPHAVLLHHESKSRGQDMSPRHIERYMRELGVLQERWATKSYVDPRHNKNLDRYSETFILRL